MSLCNGFNQFVVVFIRFSGPWAGVDSVKPM